MHLHTAIMRSRERQAERSHGFTQICRPRESMPDRTLFVARVDDAPFCYELDGESVGPGEFGLEDVLADDWYVPREAPSEEYTEVLCAGAC